MKTYRDHPVDVYENLKEMYHASAQKFDGKTLFRQKENGVYVDYSFRRYAEDVDALATELCARGFADQRVIVIGENCYAWVVSYMAAVCGTATVVPVDKEIPPEEFANIASISEASLVLYSPRAEEKLAQLDPAVKRLPFTELPVLIEKGKKRMAQGDRKYLDAPLDAGDMHILLFTSGTTGVSKGVMLSHKNICSNLAEMSRMMYIDTKDTFLSILPLHHAYECSCGFLCQVYRGSTVVFSEGLRYLIKDMAEAQPTVVNCVPMLVETIYRKIWVNIRKQDMEKKIKRIIAVTDKLHPESTRLATKKRLFSAIHKSFGGKLRALIVGGAPLDPEISAGMRALGFQIYQGYGLTECAPLAALNRDGCCSDRSVGMTPPNGLLDIYDIQRDGIGEIRYKGDNVMLGYYKMPELTAEVIRNGWLYTGDLGYMDDDGYLYITGRKKNVIVTSNGKNIFPEELETYLNRTPYIAESVVVGYLNPKKKDYDLVALVYPDIPALETTYGKNPSAEQVDYEMKKALENVNSEVQAYKRLETFLVWNTEFPKNTSRKIKRAGIADAAFEDYQKKIDG